jgi:hypothetical protein
MVRAFAALLLALPAFAQSEGWQQLFDGKTLNGWTPLETSKPGVTGDWSVRNGAISCPGTSAGWLMNSVAVADFHLRLQFRGKETTNSGVFLRSQREGQPHITGYELQIWDYQPEGYRTGSLVNTIKAPPVKIKGDHWNAYDITAIGDHFVVLLNGKPLLDAHDGAHAAGHIGFQCQPNYKIEFRNIRLLASAPK